jgi:polyphosphate glucokinase
MSEISTLDGREIHRSEPRTLALDIGGSGVKSIVLDIAGEPLCERVRLPTPRPATPDSVLETIAALADQMPPFDRVSVGFPGVVRAGVTVTAPNLDPSWRGTRLAELVTQLLKRPARAANDADVQGFGTIDGEGVELVLTLGTGLGSALFIDGILVPNLELGHHPFRHDKTNEQHLGQAAMTANGDAAWRAALHDAVELLRNTFSFDRLFLGGGNARLLADEPLPADVRLTRNIAGLLGGIALWNDVQGTTLSRAPHAVGAHSFLTPGAGAALAGPT